MIEVLRNKNLTTRFQILVEIANSGPDIQQREIARKLEITPQAVSDYVSMLIQDGLLVAQGRSSYRITNDGVNWIIRMLRDLDGYNSFVQGVINNISVCTAIAEDNLMEKQKVSLKMKDGLLFASANIEDGATGITTAAAAKGADVGITRIEGIVPLKIGRVTILRVPGIQRGGSGQIDLAKVKEQAKDRQIIATIGLEPLVALRRAGIEFYRYGAIEAAIEAAESGLNPLVVCVENETAGLISRLEKETITYELLDVEKD